MIVIAKNYEGKIIGIVNAENEKLANAFWHGRGIIPHSTTTEKELMNLDEHPHGVYPILETEEKTGYDFSDFNKRNEKIIVIK